VAFVCALGMAHTECDAVRVHAEAVQWDFLARTRASSSRSKQLHHFSRTLEERQILLCLQETGREVQEMILVEEQARSLHPFNGRDHGRTHRRGWVIIVVGCGHFQRPSRLGMLPVQDIPQFLTSAQEVLMAAGLLLECLREAWASGAGLWE
jgi:hypothetical protein